MNVDVQWGLFDRVSTGELREGIMAHFHRKGKLIGTEVQGKSAKGTVEVTGGSDTFGPGEWPAVIFSAFGCGRIISVPREVKHHEQPKST